jgi:hypothetical protein
LNAEIGERRSAVFGALGSAVSDSLGGQGFDFVIGAPILHRRDLATHLAHLRFQVAQHLEKLSGLRPWQERHWGAGYSRRPLYSPVFAISAGYVPVDQLENWLVLITAANPREATERSAFSGPQHKAGGPIV